MVLGARTHLDTLAQTQLRAVAQQPVEWPVVFHEAARHGVAALVDRALSQLAEDDAGPPLVPSEVHEDFQAFARTLALHNLGQTQELLRLVQHFEANGVPVIPFKGPALAACIYGNPSYRIYGDIDIMVPRAQHGQARQLLDELGYRLYHNHPPEVLERLIDAQLGIEYIHASEQALIELHWAFLNRIYGFALEPAAVWDRHQQRTFAGVSIRTFADEDLLIYLCVHGNKHKWVKLNWITDVAELIRASPDLDWATVEARSRALGVWRILKISILLTHDLLGAPIPPPLVHTARQDRAAYRMAQRVTENWIFGGDTGTDWESFWYHARERERWADNLGFVRHHIKLAFTPSEKDRDFMDLPDNLSFLYLLVRPARLVRDALR